MKSRAGRLAVGLVLLWAFTVPMFRSGMKSGLTFFEFVRNHTVWGDPVEYLPEEDYTGALNEND